MCENARSKTRINTNSVRSQSVWTLINRKPFFVIQKCSSNTHTASPSNNGGRDRFHFHCYDLYLLPFLYEDTLTGTISSPIMMGASAFDTRQFYGHNTSSSYSHFFVPLVLSLGHTALPTNGSILVGRGPLIRPFTI